MPTLRVLIEGGQVCNCLRTKTLFYEPAERDSSLPFPDQGPKGPFWCAITQSLPDRMERTRPPRRAGPDEAAARRLDPRSLLKSAGSSSCHRSVSLLRLNGIDLHQRWEPVAFVAFIGDREFNLRFVHDVQKVLDLLGIHGGTAKG